MFYEELYTNPAAAIVRMAHFLDLPLTEELHKSIIQSITKDDPQFLRNENLDVDADGIITKQPSQVPQHIKNFINDRWEIVSQGVWSATSYTNLYGTITGLHYPFLNRDAIGVVRMPNDEVTPLKRGLLSKKISRFGSSDRSLAKKRSKKGNKKTPGEKREEAAKAIASIRHKSMVISRNEGALDRKSLKRGLKAQKKNGYKG